ncbi:MAG: hypothetical protein IT541_17600, partial [Hyphomicrobiales bacterium]|nr:hypothetical protein [Hyphomicrobiales bacterium]
MARPWVIYLRDDQSYLRRWIGIWPFAEHHSETMLLASLGLLMMTAGALLGERRARAHGMPKRVHSLDPGTARVVGVVMLLLGVGSYLR